MSYLLLCSLRYFIHPRISYSVCIKTKMATSGEGVSSVPCCVSPSTEHCGLNNGELTCEFEVTVCTGFEIMAKEEIEEKLGMIATANRGRVNVKVPVDNATKILELRSVDNVMVIVSRFPDFQFSENQDEALLQIRSLVSRVDWSLAIEVWSQFFQFPHPISTERVSSYVVPNILQSFADEENVIDHGCTKQPENRQTFSDADKFNSVVTGNEICINASKSSLLEHDPVVTSLDTLQKLTVSKCKDHTLRQKNPLLPSFRATCHRSGTQHSFQSPAAAASFGGEINNYFGWNVDLENYDIEAVLCIDDKDIRVGISLTKESLHRRDIVQFGPTTLRPTIAHGMLRLCKILPGESVCDPMCGGGSIPVEAALSWPNAHHFCGDLDEKAVERAVTNLTSLNAKRKSRQQKSVAIDVFRWDVTTLPFKDNSIDVFITDMPFGKRLVNCLVATSQSSLLWSGSRVRNWHLYPRILQELARTCKVETGRVCLLTHDRKCLAKTLSGIGNLFRRGPTLAINIGGLAACVYVLHRTSTDFANHVCQLNVARGQ